MRGRADNNEGVEVRRKSLDEHSRIEDICEKSEERCLALRTCDREIDGGAVDENYSVFTTGTTVRDFACYLRSSSFNLRTDGEIGGNKRCGRGGRGRNVIGMDNSNGMVADRVDEVEQLAANSGGHAGDDDKGISQNVRAVKVRGGGVGFCGAEEQLSGELGDAALVEAERIDKGSETRRQSGC